MCVCSVCVCAASQKKSLVGLESTQTDGVNAVSSLEEVIDFLKEIAENDDDVSIFVAS